MVTIRMGFEVDNSLNNLSAFNTQVFEFFMCENNALNFPITENLIPNSMYFWVPFLYRSVD